MQFRGVAEQGLAEQCDYTLDEMPKRVARNHLFFEFRDAESEKGKLSIAHEIMDSFVHSLPQRNSSEGAIDSNGK